MEARHQQGPTVVMITATPVIPRPHMGARFELIGYRNYYQEIQRYVNQHGFNLQVESVSELPTTTGKIKKSEQAAWESKDVVVLTTPDHVRPQKQPLSYEHEEGTGQYRLSLDGLDCTKDFILAMLLFERSAKEIGGDKQATLQQAVNLTDPWLFWERKRSVLA